MTSTPLPSAALPSAALPGATPVERRRDLDAAPRRTASPRSVLDRGARILVSLALLSVVVWLVLNAGIARVWEARIAAFWLNPLIEGGVKASNDTFQIWIAEDHLVAFQVTAECTAIILLIPLLVLAAVLMLSRRVRWTRGLLGVASMVTLIMVVNQARLGLIGWATQVWGLEAGFEISHRFVGSAIGLLGFAAGLVVLLVVMGLRRKRPADRA